MRLTSWLSLSSKSLTGRNKRSARAKRPGRSIASPFERLEDRVLLTNLYVDDNLLVTSDVAPPGLSAGDTVTFASGETAQTAGLTFGTDAFSTIEAALGVAAPAGDTIFVAQGTYFSANTLNITKSVTITGVGDNIDDVLIQRSGPRSNSEDRVIEILSPNVTIEHLKVGGWQNVPTVGELGRGYNVWTTQPFTTLDEVNLFGDDLRVGVYIGTSNDFTFTNSRITGSYFRAGIRGAGERMNISHNKFEESHYWYGPIYMEYGAPTSGSIDHNYFVSRVGVNNDALGDFKEDGTGLYGITNLQPNVTTALGLTIEYNTFDFRDSSLVNAQGASPSPVGVFIDPLVAPSGPITVENNIFQGYDFTGAVGPTFRPGQGVFGGALEFDGVDDFATFQSADFDVGTQGSLSFWVKMDNTGRRNQFFEGPDNAGFEMQYRTNGGGQFYGRTTTVGGDFVIRSGGDSSALGVWTNLQYTWDFNASNATGKMHIYRDGVESTYLAGFTPNDLTWAAVVSTVNGVMNVGRDPGDAARFFDGMMDDVAWFNRVLTPAELTAIRTTGVAASPPANMVAYWDLDDAPGTLSIPGDAGTSITLNITPPVASAIVAPINALIDYNLFFNNDQDFNSAPTDGGNNLFGDPRFVEMGADPADFYALKYGSPALNASSDFPVGGLEKRHIGAYQDAPIGPPDTVYVDDNWVGTLFGTDPDGAGPALFFGVDAFATIQAGIDGVADDGLVVIYNGNYLENVTITREVALDGESAAGVIVDPPAGTAFTITGVGNDVVIQDLTVTGADAAFSVLGLNAFSLSGVASSANTSGGTIDSVATFTYTAADGADVINATGATLSNSGALLLDEIALNSIIALNINGAGGGDTFNITPPTNAQATNMTVNGDAGTDTLVVDTALMTGALHNLTGLGAGNFTSTSNTTLYYTTMEVVDTTTAIPTVLTGTAGADNYEVQRNGANLEIYLGGLLLGSIDYVSMTTLTFNGLGGNDSLLVDYTGGVAIQAGGLFFNGGTGTSDKLAVRGNDGQVVVYTPDAVTNGNGVIDIDGALITFTGLEPVDFDNVGSFTLNLPNDNDVVTVTNDFNTVVTGALEAVGTVPALRFSGTSGGIGFEAAHVFRTTNVTVDTTLNTDGNDTLTITSANNGHANTNLTFISGAGTDNLIVNGATTVAGTFTATVPLVNLNNNITATTITGTPTVVNVNNNSAQIQDGVDVAAAGATVNVASGFTYAEAVTVGKDLSLVAVGTLSAAIGATTGPALTVSAGAVNLTGFDATTSAASATISVTGGSLKLRQNSIVKSGAAPGASIVATGAGVLNLGANPVAGTADPGNNSITGAGALVSSATAVDASGNWWGTSVQATIGAALTANVDYTPFLNSGADSAGAVPGFQSSFTDITVHTAGPQTGPDPRITEGYNTLSNLGGIIHVLTGSYTENVNLGVVNPVDKAVTLHAGASPGQVVIDGTFTLTANDTMVIELNGFTMPGPNGPPVDPTPTNFDNFTVTGLISLGGATLQPIVNYAAMPFDRFTIINNLSGLPVASEFSAVEGTILTVGGTRLRVTYVEFHNPGSTPSTPGFFGDGDDVSLTVVTPPVLVELTTSGTLNITGTGWVDDFDLEVSGTNQITLRGNDVTNFQFGTTNTQILGPITVTGDINVSLGNSNDRVLLRGVGVGATFDSGNLNIELGSGNDSVSTTDITAPITLTTGLTLTGDLSIVGGTGDDVISLGGLAAADTFSANAISIDTGTGGIQAVALDRTTVGTNVSIKNGGAGAQTVALGVLGPNSIGRDLVITQADGATGYAVGVRDTNVGRHLQITNGNGSGLAPAAVVLVDTTAAGGARTVGGLTQITNGNNTTNAVSLVGTASSLKLTGSVTVKNGNATTSNAITVTDVIDTGTTASSFTNGSSPLNSITFNGALTNTFLGTVAATNGTSTGTNAITASRLSARGVTFKNGDATTSNTITLGGALGTDTFTVAGNTSLTNGASADIVVNVDRLTANVPSGNVTIANGASGAGGTDVIIGAVAAANSITGNLTITNQVSTGTRTNTINNATVSGGGGLSINDFGSGVSAINIGTTALVTVSKKLDIQDGSSSATTTINTATVGSMTYNDLGGGTDTINLANAAGAFQNNGVTRLNLGAGSDTVNIATTGTAIFNDSVFISLGSGNDVLNIGANANSPAFSTANRFQFDGDGGVDQITVSPLSIADYVAGSVPKKLKSKITNFESVL